MKHTISVLVENKFGVLARVAGLFSARGYNITSLTVGETQDSRFSRMTIVVNASDEIILEQIEKQLNRLIDVISVVDIAKKQFIERELILAKLGFTAKNKAKLKQVVKKHKAVVVKADKDYLLIEFISASDKVSDFLKALEAFQIIELARSGKIAMEK